MTKCGTLDKLTLWAFRGLLKVGLDDLEGPFWVHNVNGGKAELFPSRFPGPPVAAEALPQHLGVTHPRGP